MDSATLKSLTIGPDTTVREAIAAIDRSRRQIALVVDEEGRLLATVTDGDVRRGILAGVDLEGPVEQVMHTSPTTVRRGDTDETVRALIRARKLNHIPVLGRDGRLIDLATADELFGIAPRDTRVVLMAGGLGKRLRPLTELVPKPMLEVGGKPLLEQIVGVFAEQGFHRISISVNYRREMVMEHFGDGSRFGVEIDYIEEDQPLGTAGALSLMSSRPDGPFIVMNGDVLVNLRFIDLLNFHRDKGATASLVVRQYQQQVPYGVVRESDGLLTAIEEKPTQSFYVNGGIYVLNPEALDRLESGAALDMPTLLDQIAQSGENVGVYPLAEYWRDIGRVDDLEAARAEFGDQFRS